MKLKLFLSLALLTTISLAASDEVRIHLSNAELQEIIDNPTRSYVYVGREASNIADVIDEISKFEDDKDSAVWGLRDHIAKGFVIGNYDAVAQALEQAEVVMNRVDPDRTSVLSRSLDNIIEQVAEDQLNLDADILAAANVQAPDSRSCGSCHSHCLRLLRVKEKVHFLNKVKFEDTVTFNDPVTFNEGLVITGNLSLSDSTSATTGNIFQGGVSLVQTFGTDNTFVGQGAGNFTVLGVSNSGFGTDALAALTTGNTNTAVGAFALLSDTTGLQNTAIGGGALETNTIGSNNTGLGYNTLPALTTGNNNIAIGASSGQVLTTGSNNIYIGSNASSGAETGVTRIANIYVKTTGSVTTLPVIVDSTGQLGTTASTRKVKHDIADMNDVSSNIYGLRPVTFAYNNDASETTQYGLIAEEVANVFPGIVAYDQDGQPFTVQYHLLPVLMLNEVQKLAARVAVLESHLIN
jgi:Chaperone of endosialidase